jgi:hypothetical protein
MSYAWGCITSANIELDSLRLNDAIVEVKQEILVLKDEEKQFKRNLKA